MGESDLEAVSTTRNLIRSIFAFLDRPAYWLLGIVYQLFFNVASADIFSNNTIMKFYGRVQVILGVFMMFQLAMVFLRGIIEPDSFSKDKGGGSLLKRVAMSLILITLLMPISITSPRNEYEKQINNNGLLFGTLYSLQHRILSNNTIGRLVLGTNSSNSTYIDNSGDSLEKSSRLFTSTILKSFYRINLVPEDVRVDTGTKDPATRNDNRVCQNIKSDVLDAYTDLYADPQTIISMVNEKCDNNENGWDWLKNRAADLFNKIFPGDLASGKSHYVFSYMPIISTIVAIVFVFILLSFTIDIAVRSIKLAVLRLIAPIPLIAYMDPKGSGDEAFKSWSKTLTSTYLDLFIRLAVVYFVIFIIQDMIYNGIVIEHGSGVIGVLSIIIIWIGLFVFAKQAPKFIKQVLGLKDSQFNLFGGFAAMGTAAGVGAAAVGAIGSGRASARASRMSDQTRQGLGENVNPDSFWNKGKHLLAGIAGGFAGGAAGVKGAFTAKENGYKASIDAMRKRNAEALSRGDSGSTLFGRMSSTGRNLFAGEGLGAEYDRAIANDESKQKALDAAKKRVSSEMVKKDWTYGSLGIKEDVNGNKIGNVNYRQFQGDLADGKARGDGLVHSIDENGQHFTVRLTDAERQNGFLLKNNENSYIQKITSGSAPERDVELLSLLEDAERRGAASSKYDEFKDDKGNVIYTRKVKGKITTRDDLTKVSEYIGQDIRDLKRKNITNKADDRFSEKK